jgi:hypothetical protein
MILWIAVPDDDGGMWWGDPIGADTEEEVRKLAAEQWSGKLPAGVDVVIYACSATDVVELVKDKD